MSSAFMPLFKLFRANLVTRGRMVWIGLLSANMIGIGYLIGNNAESRILNVSEFIQVFGMSLLIPFVSLLFAVSVLGEHVEDGSLIYLWMRPTSRLEIVAAAYLASVSVSLPFVLVPVAVASSATGEFAQVAPGALLGASLGVAAYSAIFVLLGLRTKLALVWGLGYILFWEAIIASASKGAALVSIRGHMEVVFAELADVPIEVPAVSLGGSLLALLLIPAVAVLLTKRVFSVIEVP